MVSVKSSMLVTVISLVLMFPLLSFAASQGKAPAGSLDDNIRSLGFCFGQTSAHAHKLHDALQVAAKKSAIYFGIKLMPVSHQLRQFAKTVVDLENLVENPDPKIFGQGKNIGELKGSQLFEVENRCLKKCLESDAENDLNSCVDNCAAQEDPIYLRRSMNVAKPSHAPRNSEFRIITPTNYA